MMDKGILEMSRSKEKHSKISILFYYTALLEFAAVLDLAGEYDAACQAVERGKKFGEKYLNAKKFNEEFDRLNYRHALYLVHGGRLDEAIQEYPNKNILQAISNTKIESGSVSDQIDILPYMQAVRDGGTNPNRKSSESDIDYANRWHSNFYHNMGDYAKSIKIDLEDILERKIVDRKSESAVKACLMFARNSIYIGLYDYAKSSLATAYGMASEILDERKDADAGLFYDIFYNYFCVYYDQAEYGEAEYVLVRAHEFLDKRLNMQRKRKGTEGFIALVDKDARECLLLLKSQLLLKQGNPLEALKLSEQLIESCKMRRQNEPHRYENTFDEFYIEALVHNISVMLYQNGKNTSLTDERFGDLLQEIMHIVDELKMNTLDDIRGWRILNLQPLADFIFSYWIEFPENTLNIEDLYRFEINIKNINSDIRYMQNRVLRSNGGSDANNTMDGEREKLTREYQKAAFEEKNSREALIDDRQTLFDAKRYRLLKMSDYEFTYYEPRELQKHLNSKGAVMEFRRFTKFNLYAGEIDLSECVDLYGVFLLTKNSLAFQLLESGDKIEEAVSEFLDDIYDDSVLDAEIILSEKLRHIENLLLRPFVKELAQLKELYIIPDDGLCKIPFEIMPVLRSDKKVCYLTSARSILNVHEMVNEYRSIRVISNPEFEIKNVNMEDQRVEKEIIEEELDSFRATLLRSNISKLKYSELEASRIASVFRDNNKFVQIVQGRDARNNNVFITSTDILHFATHGFAIPERLEEEEGTSDPYDELLEKGRKKQIASSYNVFLRCGLLLAGADNWMRGMEVDGFGNGILTGMDIMSEDLREYKLVVLSACNTGQGAFEYDGNGIEGLRSAFEYAGVPIVLRTLWEIDDFVAALFMEEFYRELNKSNDPLFALNRSKQIISNMTYADLESRGFHKQAKTLFEKHLELSPEGSPFAHPRYWAAYILQGAVL